MMIIVTAISFFFGIIMYTEAILEDIKSLLSRIDVKSRSIETSAKLQMTKYCIEAINLHTRLLGYEFECWFLLHESNIIESLPSQVHGAFGWCHELRHFHGSRSECYVRGLSTVYLSIGSFKSICALFTHFVSFEFFSQSTGFPSFYDFHMPLVGIFLTTELLGIFFYCGQLLHGLLISFSERIYESEWYRHPHSIQLSALLMIQRTHRPFFISAYGMMRCNLQSYIGVSKISKTARK